MGKYNISIYTTTNIHNFTIPNYGNSSLINKADIVLVDVPCSSTGVLRRHPNQRWMMKEDDLLYNLPKLQYDILKNASYYVKPYYYYDSDDDINDNSGCLGCLIYSTCSILYS